VFALETAVEALHAKLSDQCAGVLTNLPLSVADALGVVRVSGNGCAEMNMFCLGAVPLKQNNLSRISGKSHPLSVSRDDDPLALFQETEYGVWPAVL